MLVITGHYFWQCLFTDAFKQFNTHMEIIIVTDIFSISYCDAKMHGSTLERKHQLTINKMNIQDCSGRLHNFLIRYHKL